MKRLLLIWDLLWAKEFIVSIAKQDTISTVTHCSIDMLRHTVEMHIEHYNRTVGEQYEQESAVREAQAIINGQKDIADDLPY